MRARLDWLQNVKRYLRHQPLHYKPRYADVQFVTFLKKLSNNRHLIDKRAVSGFEIANGNSFLRCEDFAMETTNPLIVHWNVCIGTPANRDW